MGAEPVGNCVPGSFPPGARASPHSIAFQPLHVPNVRRRVICEPLAQAQVGSELDDRRLDRKLSRKQTHAVRDAWSIVGSRPASRAVSVIATL